MDSVEAIRFLGLHFIDECKPFLDEDAYDSVRLILEKTNNKKLVKKILKFMEPFKPFLEGEKEVTIDEIKSIEMLSDCEISEDQAKTLIEQAKMCYMVCKAVQDIDPSTLKNIENMAKTLQGTLQTELQSIPEQSRTDINPTELLGTLMTNLKDSNTHDPEKLIDSALSSVKLDGVDTDQVKGMLNSVVPTVLNALKNGSQPTDVSDRKEKLLDMFSNIDGAVK